MVRYIYLLISLICWGVGVSYAQGSLSSVVAQDSIIAQDSVVVQNQLPVAIQDQVAVGNESPFSHPYLRHATIAYMVSDGDTVLAEQNAELLVHPASLLKLITTSTALRVLGPDYRIPRRTNLTDSVFHHKQYFIGYNPEWLIEDVDPETFKPLTAVPFAGKPLKFVITETNHRSLNEPAEMLAMLLAPSHLVTDGLDSIRAYWRMEGLDLDTCSILYDGNGLSPNDCVTVRLIDNILSRMQQDSIFRASLPVAGISGTVSGFLRNSPLAGNAQLKSGTLKSTIAYAGYMTSSQGRELRVVIIVNNYLGKRKLVRPLLEPWFNHIYEVY